LLIITFALLLRLAGLNWGLQNNELNVPRYSNHIDEINEISGCTDIDYAQKANGGTLMTYLWKGNAFMLKQLGLLHISTYPLTAYDEGYADFTFYGRLLIVLFDLISLLLVYFIVKKITRSILSSLISALIFAIIPFEILQSNYMTPHVASNTFLLLTIYLSLFICGNKKFFLFAIIGIVAGLSAAIKYTFLINIIIPLLFFYYERFSTIQEKKIAPIISIIFNKKVFIMLFFLIVGLFIGNPNLFLNFNSFRDAIIYQNGWSQHISNSSYLIKIIRIREYFTWIIPAGVSFLWLLFYPACIYSLFLKKYLKYVIPLAIYAIIYIIPMILFYPFEAIRVALPLFPIFTIITGIAISQILRQFSNNKTILYPFIGFLGFVLIFVSIFSFSVVKSLGNKKKDTFVQVFDYFNDNLQNKQSKIAILAPNFTYKKNFTNLFKALTDKNITIYYSDYYEQNHSESTFSDVNYNKIKNDSVDYVILCEYYCQFNEKVKRQIDSLTKNNAFILEKKFINDINFNYFYYEYIKYWPGDFAYPFPVFYLLKSNRK